MEVLRMAEYNIYDIDTLKAAARKVEQFNTTAQVKAVHNSKVWELQQLIEDLQTINYHLFIPDYYSPFADYAQAVSAGKKKVELDKLLKSVITETIKTLGELADIERQTHDGRLIKNPVYRTKPHLRKWIEPSELETYLKMID